MQKYDMREWVASLEEVIDNKLKKWKKEAKIENGASVKMEWDFEQTHIIIYVFWEDHKESVDMHYISPHTSIKRSWKGLDNRTFNGLQDRVGNLAVITLTPPIDPEFPDGK